MINSHYQEIVMNKDQVKGHIKEAKSNEPSLSLGGVLMNWPGMDGQPIAWLQ